MIIDAFEPAGAEAAGESHFQGVATFFFLESRSDTLVAFTWVAFIPSRIECFAIHAGGGGDIFGCFEAAFNFEAGDAGVDDAVHGFEACEILRAE